MSYWQELREEFESRTPTSKELHEENSRHVPKGVASSSRDWEPYAFHVERAEGAYLHDVDGNAYVDFDMCNGAGMAGHAHPKIAEALHGQIDDGTLFTFPHELLGKAAKELKKRWSAMDMVRFTNSGTEATMHALRVARAYSGRDKVVKIEGGYHGNHDYVNVSVSTPPGKVGHPDRPARVPEDDSAPEKTLETVEIAPFNDLDAIEDIFREHRNEIGALLIEPVMLNKAVTPPRSEYLQGLRELCDEYGVVYVMDEVKTGVKVAPGGAAEYYGVEPDLVTVAKSIGGGTSVGAFGGRQAVMETVVEGSMQHYGTYNGNPFVLRAVVTALRDVLTEDAYRHVDRLGERMASGYEEIMDDHGITGRVESVNSQGMLIFSDHPVHDYRDFLQAIDDDFHRHFWFGMLNQGV
ncbi:MAG: aspartate aminotransferase family protein, partial [Bradymonadaceae bacterium]